MLAADRTILEMYETLGMSPEAISQEQGWAIEAIRMSLMQNSQQFASQARKEANGTSLPIQQREGGQEEYPLFPEEDEKACREVLVRLAKGAELELVQASCAKAVVRLNQEERKSKRLTQIGRTNFNIVLVQQQLDRARRATQITQPQEKEAIEV